MDYVVLGYKSPHLFLSKHILYGLLLFEELEYNGSLNYTLCLFLALCLERRTATKLTAGARYQPAWQLQLRPT